MLRATRYNPLGNGKDPIMNYMVQWMDNAGIHEARFGNDLNGATTVALALVNQGHCNEISLFEEDEEKTKRVQRF